MTVFVLSAYNGNKPEATFITFSNGYPSSAQSLRFTTQMLSLLSSSWVLFSCPGSHPLTNPFCSRCYPPNSVTHTQSYLLSVSSCKLQVLSGEKQQQTKQKKTTNPTPNSIWDWVKNFIQLEREIRITAGNY